ncbi:MAG: bacterio-opsin activator domain-containing protein [Halobacteria archaeon]|nr:bacterio-opsin activator domain-containing protein [Halobacteria archaeon]
MSTGQTESLARATLDTLPINIAIIDEEGDILYTNRSWRDFAKEGGMEMSHDSIGVNYFEVSDDADDPHAKLALEGIREILSGERELFTLEYPCHSPDEKRWFLMRVAPFDIGGKRRAAVAHIDITDRKLAEIRAAEHAHEAQRERESLEHLIDRVNGLIQDVTNTLVQAETREEIESEVCKRIAGTQPYVSAWVGCPDITNEYLVKREWAGDFDPQREEDELTIDDDTAHKNPAVRAIRTRELQVIEDLADREIDSNWVSRALENGVRSIAAIPLVNTESTYGVLTVYSNRPNSFDKRERVVLVALGKAIVNAIKAVETRKILTTNKVIELDFEVSDTGLFFVGLSEDPDSRLEYQGSVYTDSGSFLMFFTVSGVSQDEIAKTPEKYEEVKKATIITDHDEGTLVEFEVSEPIVTKLAKYQAITTSIEADSGVGRITIEIPQETDARSVFDMLKNEYSGAELVGYHERERPAQTKQEYKATIQENLTERQLMTLRKAYLSGFYEWPRKISGDDLAESMDISRATFHQHLRAAERKILTEFFG